MGDQRGRRANKTQAVNKAPRVSVSAPAPLRMAPGASAAGPPALCGGGRRWRLVSSLGTMTFSELSRSHLTCSASKGALSPIVSQSKSPVHR